MRYKHGDKIVCIDASKQKVLNVGDVYTVDTSVNTTDGRVHIKEWKRFSFNEERFMLVNYNTIRNVTVDDLVSMLKERGLRLAVRDSNKPIIDKEITKEVVDVFIQSFEYLCTSDVVNGNRG